MKMVLFMWNLPCKHNCQPSLERSVSTLQFLAICVLFPDKKLFCLEVRGCDASFKRTTTRERESAVYTWWKESRVICQSILTMLTSVQEDLYMQCWMESWMQTALEKSYIPIAACGYSELLHSANCSSCSTLHLSGTDGQQQPWTGWEASAVYFSSCPSSQISPLKQEHGWMDHKVGLECSITQYNFF